MLTDDDVARIAGEVLGRTVDSNLASVEVHSAEDFDGTEIIRVMARYRRRPRGKAYRGLDPMHDIRTALLDEGEDRFVFLTNVYEDEIDPEVDDAA